MTYNKIQVAFGALRKITGPFISYQYDVQQILVMSREPNGTWLVFHFNGIQV